jgi:ABC-type nitrate/sulfonate/bicarbonate transport system substrate-binding protein
MQRRHLLQLAAVTTAASATTLAAPWVRAQPSLAKLKFTLDFRITGQTAPFFLAQSKGYYQAEGLDVQIDVGSGSVASITRVASGAYDLGFGDLGALIEFHAANPGAPLVQAVYQYYNRAPFAIIGRKDRGITTDFASLQGKRIAAAAVESTRRAWPMVAKKLGTKADGFQWITTDFSQRDNVIVRGDVDGATYFHDSAVSLFQRVNPQELAVLPYAAAGVNVYGNAILASTELATRQPKLVAGFVRATNRALVETLADPTTAIAAVKQREALIDEKLELARWAITAGYVTAGEAAADGLGDVRKFVLEQQIDMAAEVFALKTKPAADALVNRSFLPPKAERLWKA